MSLNVVFQNYLSQQSNRMSQIPKVIHFFHHLSTGKNPRKVASALNCLKVIHTFHTPTSINTNTYNKKNTYIGEI
jgi:hypothetical protein